MDLLGRWTGAPAGGQARGGHRAGRGAGAGRAGRAGFGFRGSLAVRSPCLS